MWHKNMLGYLSVPRSKQFSKSAAEGELSFDGTDSVQGQISKQVFWAQWIPSNIFCNTLYMQFLKLRNITHLMEFMYTCLRL